MTHEAQPESTSQRSWSVLSYKDWPLALALAAVVAMIAHFGANSWWLPADEGVYAHTTQRCLEGELPHRDFVYLHPGAVLWMNVLAFKIAGVDLSSLRWPAIWANLLQAVIVYLMLRPRGPWPAALGVIWVGAVGLPGIPSPSASVVCMAFCMAALLVASQDQPWSRPSSLLLLGWLLGTAFCCRQLGAAYLGCGLLSWVLSTKPVQQKGQGSWLGKLLLATSLLAVLLSVWARSDLVGTLLFAAGPVLLALQALALGQPSPLITHRLVGWVGLGFFLAFLPLILVNAYHGILGLWFQEVFVQALGSFDVGAGSRFRYSELLSEILSTLPLLHNPLHIVQFGTWLFLLLATPLTACYSLLRRFRGEEVSVYIFCAPFLALTAMIVEIEVYLFWALPPVLVAAVAIISASTEPRRRRFGLALLLLLFVGLFNSGLGKPVWAESRTNFVLTPWGQRRHLVHLGGTANLYLPAPVAGFYKRSVELIQSQVSQDETIFSFPYHPEWYFLSQRKNPTPYCIPSEALRSEKELDLLEGQLRQARPKLLIFGREDPFNNKFSRQLRQRLDDSYHRIQDFNGFEFLLRNSE